MFIIVLGWKSDISKCKTFEGLPQEAQKYIIRIEQLMGVPVTWIGVGQDRSAMIYRVNNNYID